MTNLYDILNNIIQPSSLETIDDNTKILVLNENNIQYITVGLLKSIIENGSPTGPTGDDYITNTEVHFIMEYALNSEAMVSKELPGIKNWLSSIETTKVTGQLKTGDGRTIPLYGLAESPAFYQAAFSENPEAGSDNAVILFIGNGDPGSGLYTDDTILVYTPTGSANEPYMPYEVTLTYKPEGLTTG